MEKLDSFRREVNLNLAFGPVSEIELATNEAGECPVIVALDSEPLSAVLGRVRAVGGAGTIFSQGTDGVRMVSMIESGCSLVEPGDQLAPGGESNFGMFIDYVELHPDGVAIPAAFDRPAKARDARAVDLQVA